MGFQVGEILFEPVIDGAGFLAGVRRKDESTHEHKWIFEKDADGITRIYCGCGLRDRLYSVSEALALG